MSCVQALEHAPDQELIHSLLYRFLLHCPECSYLDFSAGGMVAAVYMILRFNGGLADITHCRWIFFRCYKMHSLEGRAPSVDEFC